MVNPELTSHSIQHTLEHMVIAEKVVEHTIGTAAQLYIPETIDQFFSALRNGHREVITGQYPSAAQAIGTRENQELYRFGNPGIFAGKMAISASGIVTIERVIHGASHLQQGFMQSLRHAHGMLKRR